MNRIRLSWVLIALTIMVSFFLSSCVSSKKITYFQYDEIDQENVSNFYQTIFKPDDLLNITISSEDFEAVKPFNLSSVSFSATSNAAFGSAKQQSYLIDRKGEIDFPILGKLKIGGLTREEALILIENKLSPDYVKNPTINIRIANFKITITGDVKAPGTYTIPNERITILDAIGMAGDLNISAKRDNILVLREEGSNKIPYRANLLSNKLLTSPVFYLKQNDVIYVEHNNAKIQSASSNSNSGLFISITSLLLTLFVILTR